MKDQNPQDPFRFEREMAIAILKKRDVLALKALKQFLSNLSGPKAIEQVLVQAVCCCAEASPETLSWILEQSEQLEPELFLEQWARRWVVMSLELQGWGRDGGVGFEQRNPTQRARLWLAEPAWQLLRESSSKGEWLLLNQLFEIELKD